MAGHLGGLSYRKASIGMSMMESASSTLDRRATVLSNKLFFKLLQRNRHGEVGKIWVMFSKPSL